MIPGADLIIACPYCQAVAKVFSLRSGNLFGAIVWSDGYRDEPMMPKPPRITRCPDCARAFWTNQALSLGYCQSVTLNDAPEGEGKEPSGWSRAPYVEPLDEAGLLGALAEGLAFNAELELELRVAIWWRGNDAFRHAEAPVGYPTSPEALANMEKLLEMMEGGDEDLLLFRAEAQRQMGRFEAMRETLEGVYCSDYRPAKLRLIEWAAAGDRRLRDLFAG